MEILTSILEQQKLSDSLRSDGKMIGFVPTMGFLHEGHLSLVWRARSECDQVVVSIFVNPAQFGAGEDLAEYPRDFERDCELLRKEGVDFVFYPSEEEMYSEGDLTSVSVAKISEGLCGDLRLGHFDGVCLVVAKLFNIVKPHKVYFGQKDLQQARVVQKMVKDLNFDLEVVICPTVREEDGLAMSSRNKYLNEKERVVASILYEGLKYGKELYLKGDLDLAKVRDFIGRDAKVDYVEVRDGVLYGAIYLGKTRLIDNLMLDD